MNILGIDTSFLSDTSIGLSFDGGEQVELNLRAPLSQEEKLLAAVDTCLNVLQKKVSDIDVIATGVGPGSFTGLRIGISTARGLAWSLKKKMIGLSSLDLLVHSLQPELFGPEDLLVPMIDARMEKVFSALYLDGKKISEDMDITPGDLKDMITKRPHKKLVLFGDGLVKYRDRFVDLHPVILNDHFISGISVCDAARRYIRENPGFTGAIEDVKPVYLRKSEAEAQAEKSKR